jgi:hypothetical protein
LISYYLAYSLASLALKGHFAGIPKGIDFLPFQPAFGYGTSGDDIIGVGLARSGISHTVASLRRPIMSCIVIIELTTKFNIVRETFLLKVGRELLCV